MGRIAGKRVIRVVVPTELYEKSRMLARDSNMTLDSWIFVLLAYATSSRVTQDMIRYEVKNADKS